MSTMYTPADFSPFPWMRYALQEFGQRETASASTSNPRVVEYLRAGGVSNGSDEIAWCSGFVNWCMEQAGIRGTVRANARSWLTWGGLCLARPTYGAITVLWRVSPTSWKGHVGFYVGTEGDDLILLGGNQGSAVSLKGYPKDRLLGYRWPPGFRAPAT
jgi:uncharacterized protein (TIGR02594 family)